MPDGIEPLRTDLNNHILQDEKRYGEIQTKLATMGAKIDLLQKLIWLVFASIAGFELNAIFKLVGH